MRYFLIFIVLLFGFCNEDNGKKQNDSEKIAVANDINAETEVKAEYNKDIIYQSNLKTKEPVKTVIDFLNWYKANKEKLVSYKMLDNYSSDDTSKYYKVNFVETEKYLNEIKKSGFVSNEYVEKWRIHFSKSDSILNIDKQNDGPPEGFDFDFIFWSNDPEYDINEFPKRDYLLELKDENKAEVSIQSMIKVNLEKQGKKWFISETSGI